jgi:DNA mismatch repair protein MutL
VAIQLLPDEVASQIAAGEVIERPASVVKELLENALDAGASRIDILVEDAGRTLIQVSDDGSGIPAEELVLAVSRHATSKLHQVQDLFHVSTLGFRGEALASIASVSRMTIESRIHGVEVGMRLRVEGGRIGQAEPIGMDYGTSVRVEGLFYNVPPRLKFLKTDRTERTHISEMVSRYALAYPAVRFRLTIDGTISLQTHGDGERREVFASLYGVDVARQMLLVYSDYDELAVEGFISPTSYSRSNRKEITFFVNGRWVHDSALTAALLQAYHTLLMTGRFPLAALFIQLPPELVDINVHPAKSEVRFREKNRIFSAVQRSVRRALLAYSPVPDIGGGNLWQKDRDSEVGMEQGSSGWMEKGGGGERPFPSWSDFESAANAASLETPDQPALPGTRLPLLRLVGQVGAAYLVAEGPDGLYLVDQHAAHERVLFEQLMEGRQTGIDSQALLDPLPATFPPAQAQLLQEQLPQLDQFGFVVEPFGPGTFLIRSIPAMFSGMDPQAALRVLVEDFEEDETPLERQVEARIAARICKRAAVKAGHVLSEREQKALIEGLEGCKAPRTCPHGRPTMIHLSVSLLERQFGRRGAR